MGRKPKNKLRVKDPETRQKWIEQLTPIYMKNGLRKFTMDDISMKLGVSKATVYKHFSSRTEILEAVVNYKIHEIAAFEADTMDLNTPYKQRFKNAIHRASVRLAGISNEFLLDLKELYPEQWERIQSLQYFAAERAKEFYQEGIDKGILQNHFDPSWLAITDKIFLLGLSNPQFLIENNLTLQKAVEDYFLMKSQGIFK
ncbi:MAG: TetR/AcrR family transcriptional regulator [Saprospiraceae bacterium]